MSGQTAVCRTLYSSSRLGSTCRVKQTRGIAAPFTFSVRRPRVPVICAVQTRWWTCAGRHPEPSNDTFLEVKLIDVGGVELRGWTQHDLALRADLGRCEAVALLASDLAGGECCACVGREVAEVSRVPEGEGLDCPVLDELTHLVRGAETSELHLPLVLRT